MPTKTIYAFSSSRVGSGSYLETIAPVLQNALGDVPKRIAFVPFAAVRDSAAQYATLVQNALGSMAHNLQPVERQHAKKQIELADVIMVGGGNTFKLLHDIYHFHLLDLIRDKVSSGTPYIGWSAGSNILSPTIATTNDMPIIEPKSFNALGLLPFQINPHYSNAKAPGHNGETRDQRLEEFVTLNTGVPVLALPEGTALIMESGSLNFTGHVAGTIFSHSEGNIVKATIDPNTNISHLL